MLDLLFRKSTISRGRWPERLPLVSFSDRDEDTWTLRDAVQGTLILGETGSGKTSGSGQILARKFLKNGFGGLILCFKTEEADLWRNYLKETGREKDGRFFSVNEKYRFNFMDYEARASGLDFAENLVNLLMDVASIQSRGASDGKNAAFWLSQKKKLLRNSIGLLLMADEKIQLESIYEMMLSSPKDRMQVTDSEWQSRSFLIELLTRAEKNGANTTEWSRIQQYWLSERPDLPKETRETVDADFTGMLDPLTRGKLGQLFCTTTTLSPDDIFKGAVVVIDIPVAHYRELGQYAALIWSQLFQRATDRRVYRAPDTRPVFLWQDEAHHFTIDQDAKFQTTSRSKGICVVRLTQNLPNFLDAYGPSGKYKVYSLLGNHATKIFHRNGETETNEWASKVIAKDTSYRHSMSAAGSLDKGLSGNASVQEIEEETCPPKEFMGLANGGEDNGFKVEAILYQSGRLWLKDRRWIVRQFSQR